jgi:ABC-type branched-subunit amino acid transport system substrate-binding protein
MERRGFTRGVARIQGRSRGLIVLVAGASLVLAACSSSGGGSSSPGGATTVKIAGICDLSGALATFGHFCQQALNFAASQENANGGFTVAGKKYKLAVSVTDGKSDPTASVAAARSYMSKGYKYIFGPDTDVTGSQVLGATANQNVLEFAGGASDHAIMGTPGHTLQFGVLQPDPLWQGTSITVLKQMGITSGLVAIVYPSDVGQSEGPSFQKVLEAAGYQAKVYLYPPDTTDFRSVLTRVKADHPAVVLQGYSVAQGLPITKTVISLGVAPAVIGIGETPAQVPAVIAQSQGSFPLVWGSVIAERSMDPTTTPEFATFVKSWQAYSKQSPNSPEAQTVIWFYDPVGMLVKAMQMAGTVTDPKAIAVKLHTFSSSNPYKGALDDWYNSDNILVRGSDIALYKDGKTTWTYQPPPAGS